MSKVESSESGMKQANHGWNLVKSMHEHGFKDIVFDLLKTNQTNLSAGSKNITSTYHDVYAGSTDYTCATDVMNQT